MGSAAEEGGVAQRLGSIFAKLPESPDIGSALLKHFRGHESGWRSSRGNALLHCVEADNVHFYLFMCLFLFLLYPKHISYFCLGLLCVTVITAFFSLFVDYPRLLVLEDDINWIRKESKLLRAITEDAERITNLSEQVKKKANEAWDHSRGSETNVILGLKVPQVAWVDKTKTIVSEAEGLMKNIRCQRREALQRTLLHSVLGVTGATDEDFRQKARQVKDDISDIIETMSDLNMHICESLDRSWTSIRKLLDRPIEEHGNNWVDSKLQASADWSISSLISIDRTVKLIAKIKSSDADHRYSSPYLRTLELQLTTLQPFMQLFGRFHPESKIEKAWLEEVNDVASKAEAAVNKFLNTIAYRFTWIPVPMSNVISGWRARRKLKADLEHIKTDFSELFQMKERYGFEFILKESSKKFACVPQIDQRKDTLGAVEIICKYLPLLHPQMDWVSRKIEFLDQLKSIYRLLHFADSTNSDVNELKKACLKQMWSIAITAAESHKAFWNRPLLWNLRAGRQFSRKIDQTKLLVDILGSSVRAYRVAIVEESSSVVGLEKDIDTVVSHLLTNCGEEYCSGFDVFPIVGIEGIGKTTLAKKIYSHRALVDRFPFCAWITVPQNCSEESLFLEDLAKQVVGILGQQNLGSTCHNHLWEKVADRLLEKKYFIVLDNISTEKAWDMSKEILREKSDGSKILITTRSKDVASRAATNRCTSHRLQLRLRTSDESLELLRQMVHIAPGEEAIAREIARICSGLPLSIVQAGYLMLKQGWIAEATEKEEVPISTGGEQSKALEEIKLLESAFKKRHNRELPVDLKPFLGHFELFGTEFEIPARRLVALWVAEGLVQSGEDNYTVEQVAENCLSKLIDLGVVQVLKTRANGKVKTCCLPSRAGPLELQLSNESRQRTGHVRSVQRLAHHFNRNRGSFCLIHNDGLTRDQQESKKLHHFLPYNPREDDEPGEDINLFLAIGSELHDTNPTSFKLKYRNLLSFMSFDPREGNEPGEKLGRILRKGISRGYFQGLKVLDLERVFRPELPSGIVKLKELRYLGLRWTFLESIPLFIGDLGRLETLDLKHTYARVLPSSIWKLQRLRNLYLNQTYRTTFTRRPSGSSLKNLETLWGLFVDKNSPLKDCLDKLINIRKLGLAFQFEDQNQMELLAGHIRKLLHLHTLRLRSIDETGKPSLLFSNFSGLENLSSLSLFGKLTDWDSVAKFPKTLTELTLSASDLSTDLMSDLGKLPNLKSLCFYANPYTVEHIVCSKGFPQLRVLKFWKLEKWRTWKIHAEALQNLRELEIRSCTSLEVPYDLKNLKTLLELKLTSMPEAFIEKIKTEHRQIWGDITLVPAINH